MLARQWGAAHVETWDETVVLRELFLSGTLLCDEDEPARAARGGAGQPQVAGQSQIATSIRSHSRPQCYATDWVEARKEARHAKEKRTAFVCTLNSSRKMPLVMCAHIIMCAHMMCV